MQILRPGSSGEDVEHWQHFLHGISLYSGEANGSFDDQTKLATQEFQRRHGLNDDGIAGNRTLGEAMRVGFGPLNDDPHLPDTLDWPPQPAFPPLDGAGKHAAFGQFTFHPAPTPGNPEAIQISAAWLDENIVVATIPQLEHVRGAPPSGRAQFHRLVAPRVVELFARWQQEGLHRLILTYGGSFAPRFIRGSRSVLSQHAYGSAFDINVEWNPLGAVPALRGAKGSVRELVPIANELGFYWGGHFARRDGMHFELGRI
jgi:hypothetical protein